MAVRTYAPAAITLSAAGVSSRQVARDLCVGRATLSRWLHGAYPAPDRLYAAIERRGGTGLAEEVREQVGAARAAHVAAVEAAT